jgi:hypothetical protein
VEARLESHRRLPDIAAAQVEETRATQLQGDIWLQAVAACQEVVVKPTTMLLLPALNAMIDFMTTRTLATSMHPSPIVFVILASHGVASQQQAGHAIAGSKSHTWLHMLGFAAVITLSVYVILDLEFPHLGLIQFGAFDQLLVGLWESMQ